MFNLIKMSLYRVFHQKAFYIVPVSTAIVCCLMVYLVWLAPRLEQEAAMMEEEAGFQVSVTAEPASDSPLASMEEFNVADFMDEVFSSGILCILISVGAAIITNAEQKHGYIKNIAGQVFPKGALPLAKLPGMLLECLLILVFAFLSLTAAGRILYSDFTFGNLSGLAGAVAVQLLLSLALCALILMICTLAGNAASGIITGIALCSGLLPLVYGLIDKALWKYLHVPQSFDIAEYVLSVRLMSVTSLSDAKALTQGLVIGAAYLVVCSVGVYWIVRRKDIS